MDNKKLAEIKALAALGYSPHEICVALGIEKDADQFTATASAVYKAYWGGFFELDIPLRKSIFDLAKKGSSPAQTLAVKLLEQTEVRVFYEQ